MNRRAAARTFRPTPKPPAVSRDRDSSPPSDAPASHGHRRQLLDELVMIFCLVMFMKLFLVENYKIPTGSMTPTLLGGNVAHADANGDGQKDWIYWEDQNRAPLVFLADGEDFRSAPEFNVPPELMREWLSKRMIKRRSDRILVNKTAYWFREPRRGEIVVFKVPAAIFKPEAPIYIKRAVGEPGDVLGFTGEGQLTVAGEPVGQPPFFARHHYLNDVTTLAREFRRQPEIDYLDLGPHRVRLERIRVPEGKMFVLGDNTRGSLDSRYWGAVDIENVKGRAFFRFFPFDRLGFLR